MKPGTFWKLADSSCQVKKWGELTLETTDHVGVLQDQGKLGEDQGKLGEEVDGLEFIRSTHLKKKFIARHFVRHGGSIFLGYLEYWFWNVTIIGTIFSDLAGSFLLKGQIKFEPIATSDFGQRFDGETSWRFPTSQKCWWFWPPRIPLKESV